MALTLPYTIAPGDNINATPLQANFTAIAQKFSGGITDDDISILAAISGAKVAQNTTPGDRIASGTMTKLQMGLGSVDNAQLAALAVTKDKVTTTVGQRPTKSQIEVFTFPFSRTYSGSGFTGYKFLNATCHVATVVVGGVTSLAVQIILNYQYAAIGVASEARVNVYGDMVSPVTAIPAATYAPIGAVLYTGGVLGSSSLGLTGICQMDGELWYIAKS